MRKPLSMNLAPSKYVVINGVRRYEATCTSNYLSLYDYKLSPEYITVSRRVLERELVRIIEESLVEGGTFSDLAYKFMLAVDADSQEST